MTEPRLPCFMVTRHYQNQDFYGRDDVLQEMDSHLTNIRSCVGKVAVPRQFALRGVGGVGKTETAIQFAYTRQEKFDAVFWVNAATTSQLASDYGKIATALGLEDHDGLQDLTTSKEVAKHWMSTTKYPEDVTAASKSRVPWLLIFDNAEDPSLLSDYIPSRGAGSILVTSRKDGGESHLLRGAPCNEIEPFSEIQGAEFLRKLTACESSMQETDASYQVARHFGTLPLDMVQIAGFITKEQMSIQKFQGLSDGGRQYIGWRDHTDPFQYSRYSHSGETLTTAWTFENLSPDAWELLSVISLLDPDRIHEKIFSTRTSDVGFLQSDESFHDAEMELIRSSLIKKYQDYQELWIHRLIAKEVRTKMSPQDLGRTFSTAIAVFSSVWPFLAAVKGDATSRWQSCEDLFPHITHLRNCYREHSSDCSSYKNDIKFAVLLQDGGA